MYSYYIVGTVYIDLRAERINQHHRNCTAQQISRESCGGYYSTLGCRVTANARATFLGDDDAEARVDTAATTLKRKTTAKSSGSKEPTTFGLDLLSLSCWQSLHRLCGLRWCSVRARQETKSTMLKHSCLALRLRSRFDLVTAESPSVGLGSRIRLALLRRS